MSVCVCVCVATKGVSAFSFTARAGYGSVAHYTRLRSEVLVTNLGPGMSGLTRRHSMPVRNMWDSNYFVL